MNSVPLWHPQYSNVMSLLCPLPAVYFQEVPVYPPVGYPGSTHGYPKVSKYLPSIQPGSWVACYLVMAVLHEQA